MLNKLKYLLIALYPIIIIIDILFAIYLLIILFINEIKYSKKFTFKNVKDIWKYYKFIINVQDERK
jgi:hypothetical protein